jgi:hypothetical protein
MQRLARTCRSLPAFEGRPIRLAFKPELRAWRGKLLSGAERGQEVHGGSQIRKRLVVLDEALLRRPAELRRILVHELFHFVWLRIPHSQRLSYEALLADEFRLRARGELGWSAESRKAKLAPADIAGRTVRWREYACESFCDTAAWHYARRKRHDEFTLAPRFQRARGRWLRNLLAARPRIPL